MSESERYIDDQRKTSNGCPVAKRVPRAAANYRMPSRNVAAIDFGTTNCSVAYLTATDDPQLGPQRLSLNATHNRVPTAILFKQDGSFVSFGHEARSDYIQSLDDAERLNYYYFEEIKMNLQLDEDVSREMTVKAANGKEFYLVEVIAQILKHLKNELLESLRRADHPLKVTDFDWVITVPAIWKARGKQMMREAGYKAGLCSGFSFGKLKVASTTMPPAIREEPDSDKLSLALEPESAAIFCTLLTKQQISEYSSSLPTSSLNSYVLVDVGGGTVDISAYRIGPAPDFAIDLLHQPKGGPFGGTKVNHEFEAFLAELVNDRGFTRYLDNSDEVVFAKHQAHLNELVNDTFEKQKRIFGDKGGRSKVTGKIAIRLPHSFFTKYRDILERKLGRRHGGREPDTAPPEVELADQTLRISYSKVEKFFEPVVTGIQECMKEVLEEVEDIDTVYMVGGFGGSRYMIHALQRALGASYKYVVPMHPDLAVISGAVLFRQNPAHVNSRRADATYGFRVSIPFDADRHEVRYKAVSQSGDQELCQNIFCTIVERGDTIRTDEVFSSVHPASKHDLRRMHVDIYTSLEKDVWYTTGQRPSTDSADSEAEIRKADVQKVGELIVPLPTVGTAERVTQEGSRTAREVELFFDFSHAEAQVKGYDRSSGTEVKGVIDYLSVSR